MKKIAGCFICKLNRTKEFRVFESKFWQVDTPADIYLNGLFFIKTKRHVESLEDLNKEEQQEIGNLLSIFAKKSKTLSSAKKVITMCLGLKDPHIHFWVVPFTKENELYIQAISKAVKNLADKYRNLS